MAGAALNQLAPSVVVAPMANVSPDGVEVNCAGCDAESPPLGRVNDMVAGVNEIIGVVDTGETTRVTPTLWGLFEAPVEATETEPT